ncbi:MAG TPA: DUF58 domain-containing protein [Caulobacteraceae bacterium]|nr:DUF58 domain-containing protein [Caulobacteraceae bacterium]
MGQVTPEPLFEPGLVAVLESLTLAGRRVPSGRTAGQWRSRASGSSVEFSDYRTYAPGDEYRRIDWNAYARLERLFVRLYRAEEDLALTVLLDTSASMAWGNPKKSRLAAQLAGALTFIALQSGDRVELAACQDAAVVERLSNLRGEVATWPAWRMLERLDSRQGGTTDLNAALTAASRYLRGAGLAVIISDLLSPSGYQQGIDALLSRRQDVLLIHVLSPDEMEPPADLIGEWRLLDSESFAPVEATITPGVLKAYRRLLSAFSAEAADFCRRRGMTYLPLRSDVRLQDVLVRTFRTAGILV